MATKKRGGHKKTQSRSRSSATKRTRSSAGGSSKKTTGRSHTTSKSKARTSTTHSKTGKAKIHKVMREYKHGQLHTGSDKGPRVKSRKQAVAIALSQARKSGAKIPYPKGSNSAR